MQMGKLLGQPALARLWLEQNIEGDVWDFEAAVREIVKRHLIENSWCKKIDSAEESHFTLFH